MKFNSILFLALIALLFTACGDDDDEMASQMDLLVANDWLYGDIYVAGVPIGLGSCGGDDFLSFTAAGAVTFNVGNEPDTCVFTTVGYTGTYEVRNDSLFIDAVDADGFTVNEATSITLLNSSELRLQAVDPIIGTGEIRYTAQ